MKTKPKVEYDAKLVAYSMNYPGMAVYVAKRLRRVADSIDKEIRLQNRGKAIGFSGRFTAKLMK